MTVARILLGKTPEQRTLIKSQAESVALSMATSISALSQNTAFNREDANVILSACALVESLLAQNPDATADSLPAPSMGFQVRRQPVIDPQGFVWGP